MVLLDGSNGESDPSPTGALKPTWWFAHGVVIAVFHDFAPGMPGSQEGGTPRTSSEPSYIRGLLDFSPKAVRSRIFPFVLEFLAKKTTNSPGTVIDTDRHTKVPFLW
uniref:Uncharacterized protein n=1 Tax=Candidatus Kentrum sp. FW TaxID=2126338 RepID=A0A450TYB2_9GAMM|nr:MAG: hypothetical protein BECKFW1821C_GA0114237_10649 [Candidatus Kentron sp. FW]